jgi:hypothetical protein
MDPERPPILDYREPGDEAEAGPLRLNLLAAVLVGAIGLSAIGAVIFVLYLVLYRLSGIDSLPRA